MAIYGKCDRCKNQTINYLCAFCLNEEVEELLKRILKLEEEVKEEHAKGIHYETKINKLSRRFPIQDGPDIDWITAEKIYKMYSTLYGTSQSLERLAERGGFGWAEVKYITSEYKKKNKGECEI